MKILVRVSLSMLLSTMVVFSARAQNVANAKIAPPIISSKTSQSQLGTLCGLWQGSLHTGANTHRVSLDIATRPGSDTFAADMTTSAQSPYRVLVNTFDIHDHQVRLMMDTAGTSFEGVSNQALTEIRGTWSQDGKIYPLILRRVEPDTKATSRGKQGRNMQSDFVKSGDDSPSIPGASHRSPAFRIGPPQWFEWYAWTPQIGGQERPYGIDYW